ncbi:MAG: IS4 family transposase [Alphaproteobacteria bacterium]
MKSITQTTYFEGNISSTIEAFLRSFKIADILRRVGASKTKGIPVATVFQKLFSLAFSHKTLFMELESGLCTDVAKDTFYRFLNSCHINWMRFTTSLAALIVNDKLVGLTDKDRVNVFIVDDSPYERNRSKAVELLCRVYDHSKKIYIRGFRMLTLGWSDGNTFVPVNSCLLSSEKAKNRFREALDMDKRTCGYKRRQMAQGTAPVAMIKMIRFALKSGLKASYVLFDSWFSSPSAILSIKKEGLDVVAMVKKTSKIHYRYQGEMLPATQIYRQNQKRRGRSRYLLSVEVDVCSCDREESTPARLVFVRNRNNKKEYLVLLSTDTSLSEEEIIRIYGKRWDIEVFFKVCKSFLRLTKECKSINYDAMTAYVAVVFARYMMLSLTNRIERDDRTIGGLFYQTCDELPDIAWIEALRLLTTIFLETVREKFSLNVTELEALFEAFMAALPVSLKNRLLQCA